MGNLKICIVKAVQISKFVSFLSAMYVYLLFYFIVGKRGKDIEEIKQILHDIKRHISNMEAIRKDTRDTRNDKKDSKQIIPGELVVFSWFVFCREWVNKSK